MNVASKELCEELYKLSGWQDDLDMWFKFGKHHGTGEDKWGIMRVGEFPAYDLGYLMRKLPNYLEYWNGGNEAGYLQLIHYSTHWSCGYEDMGDSKSSLMQHLNDTPEDAACKLAIELFRNGVLTKENR